MNKKSLEFIDSVIDWEYEVFTSWIDESILANKFWKNLFSVFWDRDKVRKYLVYCSENKILL